jgi:hypothetical protein
LVAGRFFRLQDKRAKEGCEPEKIGISLGGTTGKGKTVSSNLILNMRTNPSKSPYFIRGNSKISDDFGQQ